MFNLIEEEVLEMLEKITGVKVNIYKDPEPEPEEDFEYVVYDYEDPDPKSEKYEITTYLNKINLIQDCLDREYSDVIEMMNSMNLITKEHDDEDDGIDLVYPESEPEDYVEKRFTFDEELSIWVE